jgi:predicted nucleic acid-binding protein
MSSWYLDTSALLKLVVQEKESAALRKVVGDDDVTSSFTRLEVARALNLYSAKTKKDASTLLNLISLIPIDFGIMTQAELIIQGSELKVPDAIHVATAIKMGTLIKGIITYDQQMASVASRLGIRVLAPD